MVERIFEISKPNMNSIRAVVIREYAAFFEGNLDCSRKQLPEPQGIDSFSFRGSGERLGMGLKKDDNCVVKFTYKVSNPERQEFMIGLMCGIKGSNMFWDGKKLVSVEKYIRGELQSQCEEG